MQQGSLFKRKRSKYWVAQFRDGRGGRRVQRSTGETNRILAVKRLGTAGLVVLGALEVG